VRLAATVELGSDLPFAAVCIDGSNGPSVSERFWPFKVQFKPMASDGQSQHYIGPHEFSENYDICGRLGIFKISE
jgi:hypothetical protein